MPTATTKYIVSLVHGKQQVQTNGTPRPPTCHFRGLEENEAGTAAGSKSKLRLQQTLAPYDSGPFSQGSLVQLLDNELLRPPYRTCLWGSPAAARVRPQCRHC